MSLFSLEICAGGGGQALGLERAGFEHSALVEFDAHACATLRLNRPQWNVVHGDLHKFDAKDYRDIDLLSGGVPCPPFSHAGKQLGENDERDLFPVALRLVDECRPKAVMLENVRGLLDKAFEDYRKAIERHVIKLGYVPGWKLHHASDFGVSQLRPRVVFVALKKNFASRFDWPEKHQASPKSIGDLLYGPMGERRWRGVDEWREKASSIAPTLVGGSKKHGGADLGPTRAKHAWATLGVDGSGLWDEAPPPEFVGMPRLTYQMTALIQGFPPAWRFAGRKTAAYRQIGNAFPPPVAEAVGLQIAAALSSKRKVKAA